MEKFSNGLTDAQAERLACLIEELAEAQQIACKILRHGYNSHHPATYQRNGPRLEAELGDVMHIITRMNDGGDISKAQISYWESKKAERIDKYLHHQSNQEV
jgi:hypothetical protein